MSNPFPHDEDYEQFFEPLVDTDLSDASQTPTNTNRCQLPSAGTQHPVTSDAGIPEKESQ